VSVPCRGLAQLYVCVCTMPLPGITQLYVCVCSMPWSGLTQLYACVCFMPQNYPAVCLCLYHAADKPSRMFVSVSGCGLLSCMFVSVPCLGLRHKHTAGLIRTTACYRHKHRAGLFRAAASYRHKHRAGLIRGMIQTQTYSWVNPRHVTDTNKHLG
jgi:hypothetical protein